MRTLRCLNNTGLSVYRAQLVVPSRSRRSRTICEKPPIPPLCMNMYRPHYVVVALCASSIAAAYVMTFSCMHTAATMPFRGDKQYVRLRRVRFNASSAHNKCSVTWRMHDGEHFTYLHRVAARFIHCHAWSCSAHMRKEQRTNYFLREPFKIL